MPAITLNLILELGEATFAAAAHGRVPPLAPTPEACGADVPLFRTAVASVVRARQAAAALWAIVPPEAVSEASPPLLQIRTQRH